MCVSKNLPSPYLIVVQDNLAIFEIPPEFHLGTNVTTEMREIITMF